MKSLWAHWPRLRQAAGDATHLLLALDVDGTLAPIADHPSQARLPVRTRQILKRLAGHPAASVVLISGRALRELKALIRLRQAYYVGNHGLELEGPRLRYVHPAAQASRPLMRRLAGTLRAALQPMRGAWVEAKGLTLSLHWRSVPPSARPRCHRLIAQSLAPSLQRGAIRVTQGKRVTEVRPPVRWGKGEAIAWLLARRRLMPGRSRALVICVGDDQTDEDAFRTVNRLGGVSVFVGNRSRATSLLRRDSRSGRYQRDRGVAEPRRVRHFAPASMTGASPSALARGFVPRRGTQSQARWRLKDPREVRKMLEGLLRARGERP